MTPNEGGDRDKGESDRASDVGDRESTNGDQPMVVGIKGWEVSRLPPKGLPGIWGWTEELTPGHTEEETREPGGS